MSDSKIEKIKVTTIQEDKVIELKIGGSFYQRLNKLLIDYGDSVNKKQLITSMMKIKRGLNTEKDAFTFNLETLVILLHNVETKFTEYGFVIEQEIELEVPKEYKEMNIDLDDENSNQEK